MSKYNLKIILGVMWAYKKTFSLIFFPFFSLMAFELYENGITWSILWYMLAMPFLLIGILIYMVRNFFAMLLNDPIKALLKVSSDIYTYPSDKGITPQMVESLLSAEQMIIRGAFGGLEENKSQEKVTHENKKDINKGKNKSVQDVKIK